MPTIIQARATNLYVKSMTATPYGRSIVTTRCTADALRVTAEEAAILCDADLSGKPSTDKNPSPYLRVEVEA